MTTIPMMASMNMVFALLRLSSMLSDPVEVT